jgi:enamine deaminase RidA (YjgF/YER057c/UK114 family)
VRDDDRRRLQRVGDVLYTPGILPTWGEELRAVGMVEEQVPLPAATEAARLCVLNMLALVRAELGSLDMVQGVSQLNVLVRSGNSSGAYARVADGASAALFEVFGERGRHRREVLATRDLPGGAVVQISGVLKLN